MSGGMMVVPDSPVTFNFNLATYCGEQGVAGGLVGRDAPKIYINGGRVGIAFGL